MSDVNPAVVLGLNPNGLGIVRSLSAAGVPVIGVDMRPEGPGDAHRWMSSRTRLCRKVFYRGTGADSLLQCLLALGETLTERGVLIPSGDRELLCVSRNRDSLAKFFHFRVPEPDVVELLADKARFYPFVRELGVPLPLTFVKPEPENIEQIAAEIGYPCLIKPNLPDKSWSRIFPGYKALTAASPTDLVALFHRVHSQYREFLIQEVVPGPDCNLYFSHTYLSDAMQPLALWTGRKIRQLPIHFGTSTMTETVWVKQVADSTLAMLRELECRGYASVEFKLDPRDGQYKIMEITQGRTWYPHYLGFGAGVNIPHIWYQDLLGRTVPPATKAREGVRWIDEYRDVIACVAYWKQDELTFREWAHSFRGKLVYSYASLRDPIPFVFVILQLLVTIPRKLFRTIFRLQGRSSQQVPPDIRL